MTPVVTQTGPLERQNRDAVRDQNIYTRPTPYTSYVSSREDAIPCRETSSGTYEVLLGGDAVTQTSPGRKGQLVDFWV